MRLVVQGLIAVLIVALLGIAPVAAQDDAPRTTKCFQCQPFVDEYNAATAAVAPLQAERDRLDTETKAVQARIEPAQEEMDRAARRVARAEDQLRVDRLNERHPSDLRKSEENVAKEQKRLDEALARGAEINAQLDILEPQLIAAEAALAEARAAQAAALAKLDACEKLCQARGGISTISEDGRTVATWCAACQYLADALNETLAERRRIGGEIVLAEEALQAAKDAEAALRGEQRAALDAATVASGDSQRLRAAKPVNQKALNEAVQRASAAAARANAIDTELVPKMAAVRIAQAEIDRLTDRRDRVLPQQEADQRAALEDCENAMCGPPTPKPLGQLGTPAGPPVVTTECPACQPLADRLQVTLNALARKGAAVDAAKAELAAEQAALDAAPDAEKGAHEDAITRLEERRDALLRQFNDLRGLAEEQRADLEKCERECKKAPPERPLPDLRTSLLQEDDECRRNQECALVATLTNEGEDDVGPLFISFDAKLLLPEDGQLNGLSCLATTRGKTLCYGEDVFLEQGASLVLVVPAVAEPEICFAREMPHADDHTTIGAWVQFGLTDRGFPLGAIDGQIGPKTYAAIAALIESDDAPAPVGMTDDELRALLDQRTAINRDLIESEVFERLFGEQPSSAEDREEMLDCIRLRLVREAQVPKPKAAVPVEEEEDDTVRLDTRPRIVLDLGGGGGEEEPVQEESESFPVEDPGFGELPGLGEFGF